MIEELMLQHLKSESGLEEVGPSGRTLRLISFGLGWLV